MIVGKRVMGTPSQTSLLCPPSQTIICSRGLPHVRLHFCWILYLSHLYPIRTAYYFLSKDFIIPINERTHHIILYIHIIWKIKKKTKNTILHKIDKSQRHHFTLPHFFSHPSVHRSTWSRNSFCWSRCWANSFAPNHHSGSDWDIAIPSDVTYR